MILADTDTIPTIIQIPKQIQKQELLKLMPLEWLTNYEHFHQNSEPVQITEATFERRQNGQVKLSFQTPETKPVSDTPQLSYTTMITAVQTGQEKNLPIHGFSSEGYPVYPDKINGHFLWDVSEAHMCNPDCPCLDDMDIDEELKIMRGKKKKKNKSSYPKSSCKSFPPPDPKPHVQKIRSCLMFSSQSQSYEESFPPLEKQIDTQTRVTSKPYVQSSVTAFGQPEEPKQYEVVLNWQTKNASAQNQALHQLGKKIDRVANPQQQPVYNQFFGFSHLQPTPQPKPSSPKKSKSKVKILEPKTTATSSSLVPPVPPEDSPKATPEPPKKDKGPMDQYHYHTVQNTSSNSSEPEPDYESNPSESNPSSSSSSSTNSIGTSTNSESEYADITSILMTAKTEDPSVSTATPIIEESSSDAENQTAQTAHTEPKPSMPPPVTSHSTKPSSASWFTFDDIPRHKWSARLQEFAAWIDLQGTKPNAQLESVLREFMARTTGSLRDWLESLGEYRQVQFIQAPIGIALKSSMNNSLHLQHSSLLSENKDVESNFSEQSSQDDQIAFILAESSDFDDISIISTVQNLNHVSFIPRPSLKMSILPSKFHKLVPVIGFIDTGADTNNHSQFHHPSPLWKNEQFFIHLPFKLNEDINPTKASHPGMSPSDLLLAKQECSQLLQQGLIEPTDSNWACQAFYVEKRSELVRGKKWLQNHALDLPTPEHHTDTLMVLAESDQIPRQIPRHELIKLMPLEWISNYEQFHNNTTPIQTSESMFERRHDGTVRMTFKPPPSAPQEPPRLSFTYSSMITVVQTAQEDLPITGFNSEGYPVYPAKHNGHFQWDAPGSGIQTQNAKAQNDTLLHLNSKVEHISLRTEQIKTKVDSITAQMQQIHQNLHSQIGQLDSELRAMLAHRYNGPEFDQKEIEIRCLKAELAQIKSEKQRPTLFTTSPHIPSIGPTYHPFASMLCPIKQYDPSKLFGMTHTLFRDNPLPPPPKPKPKPRLQPRPAPLYPSSLTILGQPSPTFTPTSPPAPLSVPTQSKDKEPMHQFTAHTVDHSSTTDNQTSNSNLAVSDSHTETDTESSVSTSDSEKSYADITRILMAQPDQPPPGQTSHTEPYVDIPSEVEEEMPESSATNQSPPAQAHTSSPSQKSSNGPWFTFDDLPSHKWRDRLNEMSTWIDLQMLLPGTTTQSVLREFATRFTGALRDWFDSLGQYRQLQFVDLPEVSSALAVLHDQFLGDPSAVFEAAKRDYLNMKCCSLNAKDLDFHYKRMSLLFYKLNGFNKPTLKHVFLTSLPEELQPDIQRQLTASNLSLDNISLSKIFQLAKTCLDKLCEQKQFFKELLKDKEPFRSACKKPYLQIKYHKKKDCDCGSKKKRHFRKSKNPEFSSKPRRSQKPYRFFRKKSPSTREFKRKQSSRCFICKRKGHYAKDCPNKREKSIRLVKHLQATTDYSPAKDELEFYFSEQDEPNDETVFALQNSSDSDSDQSQVIFHQQLLSLDTTFPIPSIKLQILPSKFQRPIPAIGLIDTGAQRSMLNPHLLPLEYWTQSEEHFKAVNGKLFTTSLITKKPIGIQIFPNCVIWTKVIGSTLPNKDILLGSHDDHRQLLTQFYDIIQSHGIMLSAKKSTIATDNIEFLGMIIKDGHYQPGKHIAQELLHFPDQQLFKRQIQQFLGIINYIRDFLPHVDHHTHHLSALLKKQPPEWNADHIAAVTTLKQIAQNPPPLKLITDGKRILQTDASDESWGAILLEELNDKEHFIAYASGHFSETQKHYHSVFKEILAVKNGIKKFEYHLIGHHFLIRMDSSAFPNIFHFKGKIVPEKMLLRLKDWFSKYDFSVKHIKGSQNLIPDMLSRLSKPQDPLTLFSTTYHFPIISMATSLPPEALTKKTFPFNKTFSSIFAIQEFARKALFRFFMKAYLVTDPFPFSTFHPENLFLTSLTLDPTRDTTEDVLWYIWCLTVLYATNTTVHISLYYSQAILPTSRHQSLLDSRSGPQHDLLMIPTPSAISKPKSTGIIIKEERPDYTDLLYQDSQDPWEDFLPLSQHLHQFPQPTMDEPGPSEPGPSTQPSKRPAQPSKVDKATQTSPKYTPKCTPRDYNCPYPPCRGPSCKHPKLSKTFFQKHPHSGDTDPDETESSSEDEYMNLRSP
ncbi:hypothetical protein KPL71_004238 [Citrus sinensis]|uniref:Uncharacterized protein n=1 Tax=Citrus sinensis TaxID=2711 RepID=A0ACB8N3P0_CITSI|nr:hypothetical protein KPL71_004238 [Citrus sinensis]